ncbi:hypothetical protein RHGRI_012572 [Rhododendron griersonianum]|uniref:Transducin/WD40 repeat-like superfamily protein n=1 Tax=Rhododendron griersonianum TaxID=479676 RepID=A0AAV6KR21_9ERIC|nr:hypothetical protein RHGRI_012572 [Rhododendron griersonianum]
MEATQNYSGAVTALIYYKGELCSGYADGSIKVWDIKGQKATLVLDMKEHKKAVTCFPLFEPGDCMLSGSADKTIRIWQMVRRKLECIEVIGMKESIQSLDTSGQLIFTVTQSHELKVIDSSRKARDLYKSKPVKCVRVIQGKVYVGCMDSSIQELAIENNREREIKAPSKIWMIQSRPVNSISVYKDWLYSASAVVDGSNIKEWRRQSKPQMSLLPDRGTNVLAMEVVEDFIYLNCSSSTSVLQAEPDPRFVFQFDGEPKCSPQVFQIQGSIRQPVFTCKFSFRSNVDQNQISSSTGSPSVVLRCSRSRGVFGSRFSLASSAFEATLIGIKYPEGDRSSDSLRTGLPALLRTTAIEDLARITRPLSPALELSSDAEYGGPNNSRKGIAHVGRFTLLQLQKRGEDRGILPAVALLVVVGEIGPSEFRRGDF